MKPIRLGLLSLCLIGLAFATGPACTPSATTSMGATFTPQVPIGTEIPLTFSPSSQTDGGQLVSNVFATGCEPISAIIAIGVPTTGSSIVGTACLLVSDDGTYFLDAGYCASYSKANATATLVVGEATGVPTPYNFAEFVVTPNSQATGNDGGVIIGGAATLGR